MIITTSFFHRSFCQSIAIALMLLCAQPSAADKAPDFELQGQTGEVKLSDYRGKVVYLDFWASWCTPCLKSFPWMEDIQQKYRERGLMVIAVNLDKEKHLADKFLATHPVTFPTLFDPQGTTPAAFSVRGMPTSLIIARDGNIVSTHTGFNSTKQKSYEQSIRAALSSSVLATTTPKS